MDWKVLFWNAAMLLYSFMIRPVEADVKGLSTLSNNSVVSFFSLSLQYLRNVLPPKFSRHPERLCPSSTLQTCRSFSLDVWGSAPTLSHNLTNTNTHCYITCTVHVMWTVMRSTRYCTVDLPCWQFLTDDVIVWDWIEETWRKPEGSYFKARHKKRCFTDSLMSSYFTPKFCIKKISHFISITLRYFGHCYITENHDCIYVSNSKQQSINIIIHRGKCYRTFK